MNTITKEKRRRGRPRKIAPNNNNNLLSESMVTPDGEVVYSDEFPEFFKIYLPALCSEIMRIPPDFIEKFGGEIPANVTLRRPGMMAWQVGVKKIEDHWFLEKGWPQFVSDNSIQDGDFLTFSYAGFSMFFVKVFAKNGCRKRVVHHHAPTTPIAAAADDDDEEDNEDEDEDEDDDNDEEEEDDEEEEEEDDDNDDQSIHNNQSPEKPKINDVTTRRNGMSPRKQNECKNPCFSQIMLKSYEKGSMHIPMVFWREWMGKHVKGSRMVTLQVKNKSWVVGLSDFGDRVVLSRGWAQFMKDNSLRVGNKCTFEFIDITRLIFNVTFHK